MKTSKEVRESIGELLAKAEAINAFAISEERDLTSDEQAEFDGIVAQVGDQGDEKHKATGLWAKVQELEKRERFLSQSLQARAPVAPQSGMAPAQPRSANKLRAFSSAQDAYDAGRWLQAMFHRDPEIQASARQYCRDKGIGDIRAAQTGSSAGAGGYLVPDPLSDAIVRVREQVGVARRVCRIVPMTSDTLSIPKESTFQTVYYPAQGAAITASDMAWTNVSLTAVKRATLTAVSNELIADALVDAMDEVAVGAAYKLVLTEDDEFINGDGSSYGGETGLITACGNGGKHVLATDSTFSSLTLADLSTVQALIAEPYWNDANMAWIMRRDTYVSIVEKLTFALGGNTSLTFANGVPMAMLKGYPVYFTDRMPTTAASKAICFFGNFRDSVVIGDRQGITAAMSQDAGFTIDATYVRLTARYDINVHAGPGSSTEGGYAGIFTGAAS